MFELFCLVNNFMTKKKKEKEKKKKRKLLMVVAGFDPEFTFVNCGHLKNFLLLPDLKI